MSDKSDNAMDYKEHESSYELFIKIAKYGGIATIVVVVLLALITL